MGEYHSADERKRRIMKMMPGDLGIQYHIISKDVACLHVKWANFCELYADQETIDLLNETAGEFFHDVCIMMLKDVILNICRLSDPPRTGVNKNLSVRRLCDLVLERNPELQSPLADLTTIFDSRVEFAIKLRHKIIAHGDLEIAVGHYEKTLELASRDQVNQALESLRSIMNCIEDRIFPEGKTAYQLTIRSPRGVKSLIHSLKIANDVFKQQRLEIESIHENSKRAPP